MKADASEEARVAKNESAFCLMQNQVVMFFGTEAGRLDAQFPGHAKMNPKPIPAGKFKEHLFSPGERPEKTPPSQFSFQRSRIRATKDSLLRMELERDHLLAEAWIPLPAKKFHLGQFRHCAK